MKNSENSKHESEGIRLSKIVKIEKFKRWWKENNFIQMAKDNEVSISLAIEVILQLSQKTGALFFFPQVH